METFGERIKRLMKERGLSGRKLSARAGLSASHVALIFKRGTTVEKETLFKLARALEVPAEYLEYGDEAPPSDADERYPARAKGAWFARQNGVAEWAIEEVLSLANVESPMTPEHWYNLMKATSMRGRLLPPANPVLADIEGARKKRRR